MQLSRRVCQPTSPSIDYQETDAGKLWPNNDSRLNLENPKMVMMLSETQLTI
jgi:hypothetical protein